MTNDHCEVIAEGDHAACGFAEPRERSGRSAYRQRFCEAATGKPTAP
jgi:hypothetical protein